jgi:CheY-like chemotaxis protein
MLENLGYRVDVASNGEEAMLFYSTNQYAAILTDINMPEMSGIEVSAEIRRRETMTKKRIPIIALTADVTQETKQDCLAAGIDEVAKKPIKSDMLQTIFQHYLVAE